MRVGGPSELARMKPSQLGAPNRFEIEQKAFRSDSQGSYTREETGVFGGIFTTLEGIRNF